MKKLSDLLNAVDSAKTSYAGTEQNPVIKGLSADSRDIQPGFVFFAIKGEQTDGNEFVESAVQNGASAVISEKPRPGGFSGAAYTVVEDINRSIAQVSRAYYDSADKKLSLIGITGTNGKTTTASLIDHLLHSAGEKTLFVGTTGIRLGAHEIHSDYTTPPPHILHRLFHDAAGQDVRYAVMEVSSHALALDRAFGLRFHSAVFTNLTHEHLELHADMEDYFQTKSKLFANLAEKGTALLNTDDPYGRRLAGLYKDDDRFFTYGHSAPDFALGSYSFEPSQNRCRLEYRFRGARAASCNLIGSHNGYNCLAALGTLAKLGFDLDAAERDLESVPPIPGRFEWFREKGLNVVVDFAHSPDALQKLTDAVRHLKKDLGLSDSRVLLVFGCPGNRDPGKRPAMGKIAAESADLVFVTSDDPHYEEPEAIVENIMTGIPAELTDRVKKQTDRRSAIREALEAAKPGDFVVVAGRGHQRYQYVREKKIEFNDKTEILEILAGRR